MEQIIAIDPDIEKNGVCIIQNNRVELFIYNFETLAFTFFKNIKQQMNDNPSLKIKLFIEAGYLNKKYYQPVKSNELVVAKINRNIGENHAVAKLLVQCAKYYNLDPIETYPVRSANYKTRGKKITHDQFVDMLTRNNLFCNVQITNQEIRDAALLAVTYGINMEDTGVNNIIIETKKPQYATVTKVKANKEPKEEMSLHNIQ